MGYSKAGGPLPTAKAQSPAIELLEDRTLLSNFSIADVTVAETDADSIQVSILAWPGVPRDLTTVEDAESQALLESLVDHCTVIDATDSELLLSIVKNRSSPGP